MARNKRVKKQKAQIDVDWLLGEATPQDVHRHVWLGRLVWTVIFAASSTVAWPYLSKQFLAWQFNQQVAQGADDEALWLMVAMNDLAANRTNILVSELASEDENRRVLAFDLLKEYVAKLEGVSNTSARADVCQQLLDLKPSDDGSSMMRGVLASMLARQIPNDEKNKSLRQSMDTLAMHAIPDDESKLAPVIPPPSQEKRGVVARIGDSNEASERESATASLSGGSKTAVRSTFRTLRDDSESSTHNNIVESSSPRIVRSGPESPDSLAAWNGPPPSLQSASSYNTLRDEGAPRPLPPSKFTNGSQTRMISDQSSTNHIDDVAQDQSPNRVAEPRPMRSFSTESIPSSPSQPWLPSLSSASDRSSTVSIAPRSEFDETPVTTSKPKAITTTEDEDGSKRIRPNSRLATIDQARSDDHAQNGMQESRLPLQGLAKRTIDELVPLLGSAQERIVTQVVEELQRRNMRRQHIEIALELARGSADDRIQAMNRLVADGKINPVPWLVWMAEGSDRSVRVRAIALLGSIADEEALRKLRLLKQREADTAISEQITQVLVAAGAGSNTRR